jgi:hypothetical protein
MKEEHGGGQDSYRVVTPVKTKKTMDNGQHNTYILKIAVFCSVAPSGMVESYRRFGGACCLFLCDLR